MAGDGRFDESGPRGVAGSSRLNAVGLGAWGIRCVELLRKEGFGVRAVDLGAAADRADVEPERRHRIDVETRTDGYATAVRALVADEGLARGLTEDADADLIVVAADLSPGAGVLLGALLDRLGEVAPGTGRLAIARLPGGRFGPDERALALVALNAALRGAGCGLLLVREPDEADAGRDRTAVVRLAELWRWAAGEAGEALLTPGIRGLARLLATPGFVGWREIELEREDCAAGAEAWRERLGDDPVRWQPAGYAWPEAQAVLVAARAPGAWLDEGGRGHFERLVEAAWDEAAPCQLQRALVAGERPARAILVSVGMPYPREVLALRDGVEADRARLVEKREVAGSPIPLGEGFLPGAAQALVGAETPASPPEAGRPPVVPPEADGAPARPAGFPAPGEVPAAYEAALDLMRRILGAGDPRSEVDLGEIRYALYDLLEILREEPERILPEVFRPTLDEWFERHHVNVAVLAILAGDLIEGSLSEVVDLGTAALLHDLGMVPTRDAWDSPETLDVEAFERSVRPHPEEGFRRLQDVPGMTATIARIVLEEHERMDGTGYPEGMAGETIDPRARVLAACDTLEALTHPRQHRTETLGVRKALERLRALGEYTLDRSIVDVLHDELGEISRRMGREQEPTR